MSTYRAFNDSFQIDAIAVAMRYRHKGGGWAHEALSTTLGYITADADENNYLHVKVAAHIHEDNRPSQMLFEKERFAHTDMYDDVHQVWSVELDIAGADLDAS